MPEFLYIIYKIHQEKNVDLKTGFLRIFVWKIVEVKQNIIKSPTLDSNKNIEVFLTTVWLRMSNFVMIYMYIILTYY